MRDMDLDPAAEILRAQLPGKEIAISRPERTLRFPTSDTEAVLSQMLGKIVAAGAQVAQFREVVGDLEDAFLSVATGNASSSQPASPAAVRHLAQH